MAIDGSRLDLGLGLEYVMERDSLHSDDNCDFYV